MKTNVSILEDEQATDVRLVAQLAGFTRHARLNRFNVGLRESIDCQRMALKIGILNKRRIQNALKTLMCASQDDWTRFDELFDTYWQGESIRQNSRTSIGGGQARSSALATAVGTGKNGSFDIPDASAIGESSDGIANTSHEGASTAESIAKKNFEQLGNVSELRAMEDLAEQLAARIRRRILRRQRVQRRGSIVDIRHTLRDSLRYGGLPFALKYRKRRRQVPKIVLLLDVSRSMSVYSYLFLRFARGVLGAFKASDAFAFHTRLIHIGELLREPNRQKMIEKMVLISTGWSGGTKIGESLAAFNRDYAANVLNSRSIVIVVSDGYDTGEPSQLVGELKKIRLRARRLIWLNPLLGMSGYSPSTRCMKAALPLLDIFAPANNLQSLAELEVPLSRL